MDYRTPIGVFAGMVGVTLIWSALTGQNPLDEARKLLTTGAFDGTGPDGGGQPLDSGALTDDEFRDLIESGGTFTDDQGRIFSPGEVTNDGSIFDGTTGTSVEIPGFAGGGSWPKDPSNLVSIGQGGHRLAQPAAVAFRAVEQRFGRQIPVTDSYRNQAGQAVNAANDPDRFGSNSAHPEGRAVDVNLGAIGANPQGEPTNWLQDPAYAALVAAFTAEGWCNYQLKNGTARGRLREPWHFSWKVCK